MKILFVSVEVAPFAKVGGLADVAGSLPKALRDMGHDVRIVMPAYQMILDEPSWNAAKRGGDFRVEMNSEWSKWASIHETDLDGVPVYLLGTDEWFTNAVSSETVYRAGHEQYLFFAQAVLDLPEELDWKPDVIHCNDWHTGFVPVLMRERGAKWEDTGVVYTIHNLAYQGEFDVEVLDCAGLPRSLFNMHRLETYGSVNFLKAGCVYADQVNTVSPSYALEIQTPQFGCRLEGLMEHLADYGRLTGILNGLDEDEWNPNSRHEIPSPFTVSDLAGKGMCKDALRSELGLPNTPGVPLAGVVSRLSDQKGMHLFWQAAPELFALPVQIVVQGLGDHHLAHQFTELERMYPDQFRFVQRFDAALAQRIYAGSDMFLMPSMFEPCGLGQLIAMRYGTVPVVRRTGGLMDTVFEGDNGFVFDEPTSAKFYDAVHRASRAYAGSGWPDLVRRCMNFDSSWVKSAAEYVHLYENSVSRRRSGGVTGIR